MTTEILRDETPDAAWERLHLVLKHRDVSLFVGAGISVGSKLPTWELLVAKLIPENLTFVREWNIALPRKLSFLQDYYNRESGSPSWHEKVREAIYSDYIELRSDCGLRPHDHPRYADRSVAAHAYREKLVSFFQTTNPVLSNIVAMCSYIENSNSLGNREHRANKRVKAIVNYNIDGLLQELDTVRHFPNRILRTVERASKEGRPDSISIYHVHGFIKTIAAGTTDEAPDRLVLTEQEYHDWTDDPLSFANGAALQTLRNTPCIFVGCSMNDELMRRSLRRWFRERVLSVSAEYGIDNPLDDLSDWTKIKRWRRHFAVTKMPNDKAQLRAIDSEYRLSGVWPLWVRDYQEDLPDRLRALGGFLHNA